MKKTAFITGINGQDGSYLAEFLLQKNYQIVGFKKNQKVTQCDYLKDLQKKIHYISGDLSDHASIYSAIQDTQPDEVYNLASQSYPGESWELSKETAMTNAIGAHLLFDVVRKINPNIRIFQASSSEMYGQVIETPQNENTPFNPLNPYAAAKTYAHHIANIYRKSYGMFISCGILFNHESPRRGLCFITQKVAYAVACIKLGILTSPDVNEYGEPIVKEGILSLGNLNAKRDWGYAGDYVESMWLMLQQDQSDNFVIGTGQCRTIRELCETAFSFMNLNYEKHVKVDSRLMRPIETEATVADINKAKQILGWEPKTSFPELIQKMIMTHIQKFALKA